MPFFKKQSFKKRSDVFIRPLLRGHMGKEMITSKYCHTNCPSTSYFMVFKTWKKEIGKDIYDEN